MFIDVSKLSRDYSLYPLKRGNNSPHNPIPAEYPTKNDLQFLYIDMNLSYDELAKYFKRSRSAVKRWLVSHGLSKSHDLRNKNGLKSKLSKYGDENFNNIEKCRKTKLVRHGDENFNNVIAAKETKLLRYGDENFNNIEKLIETWGKKSKNDLDEILTKRKNTNISRYGYDNPMRQPEFKKRFFENFGAKRSKPEIELEMWFLDNNIEVETQYVLIHNSKVRVYDFYLPKFNMLVEFDGEFFHRLEEQKENDEFKNWMAKDQGYRLVRIKGESNINTLWEIQNI
jgi:very-short-patch-repair endonuclease